MIWFMSSVHWIFSISKDVLFGGKKKEGGEKAIGEIATQVMQCGIIYL